MTKTERNITCKNNKMQQTSASKKKANKSENGSNFDKQKREQQKIIVQYFNLFCLLVDYYNSFGNHGENYFQHDEDEERQKS